MRPLEINFGAIIRPISFQLPTTWIWGQVTDCTGLSLGNGSEEYSGWANLRTLDEIEACASWLDGLWMCAIDARSLALSHERKDIGLFVQGISPQYEDEYEGSTDLEINAVVSAPAHDLCIYLGRQAGDKDDVFDYGDTLKYEHDVKALASLLRDVATAMREKRFHYGRGNPMKAYFKSKPAPKPLLLTERRAS
ncbi:MAG: hypothetical protein WAW39_02280 [Prosthecobacter sp.]|uniref:hypothetical protein n=1 Tax=Prosthecobacter sp. TaxID=1965333 RepID=UPI003BB12355